MLIVRRASLRRDIFRANRERGSPRVERLSFLRPRKIPSPPTNLNSYGYEIPLPAPLRATGLRATYDAGHSHRG